MENPGLGENILIEPGDVLSAEEAVVFITGEVLKPGPFELSGQESVSMTELISRGGGLTRDAAPQKVKILRPILNGSRRAEITVDAKRVLSGHAEDFRILPNDLVVVPRSGGWLRTAGKVSLFAIPILVSVLIVALH
jgi:protein involved in polysaccharide export with SLBB domain